MRDDRHDAVAERLTLEAAVEGQLEVRADEEQYRGEYRQIIHGMNNTLEGFATPMRRHQPGAAAHGREGLHGGRQ